MSVAVTDVEDAPGGGDAEEPPPTRSATATRLIGLVAGTAAVTLLILATGGWPWLVVVGSILGIIMLHEAGHFVTAKWSGMKATEFFVGFGPRLWSIRRGETEYGIKAIPAGGYVKILGMTSLEELEPTDEPRSFVNQTTGKRVLVASAGSLVHLLLALSLAFAALFFIGEYKAGPVQIYQLVHIKGVVSPVQLAGLHTGDVVESIDGKKTSSANFESQLQATKGRAASFVVNRDGRVLTLRITPRALLGASQGLKFGVSANYPAQLAGLRAGDVIESIAGKKTNSANFESEIQATKGHAAVFVVLRHARLLTLRVTPRPLFGASQGLKLGVEANYLAGPLQHFSFLGAFTGAGTLVWQVTDETFHVFTSAFSPSGLSSLAHQVASPAAAARARASGTQSVSMIGAAQYIADAAQAGVLQLLGILISLNISLGVLNMLPMLPLDGGHVAIALYERIRTRRGKARYRADVKKLMPVVYAFLSLLALFVAGKMYLDIAHGTANPFG